MTDLEMTRLCAEAIGGNALEFVNSECDRDLYDPLHDDAQAMALLKKFKLDILSEQEKDGFIVSPASGGKYGVNSDLNRAIVECVAKMQTAK